MKSRFDHPSSELAPLPTQPGANYPTTYPAAGVNPFFSQPLPMDTQTFQPSQQTTDEPYQRVVEKKDEFSRVYEGNRIDSQPQQLVNPFAAVLPTPALSKSRNETPPVSSNRFLFYLIYVECSKKIDCFFFEYKMV